MIRPVTAPASDALVLFGATGDLAYKKIFPALQQLFLCGGVDVPVLAVARSGWTLERLRQRLADSLRHHGSSTRTATSASRAACVAWTATTRTAPLKRVDR